MPTYLDSILGYHRRRAAEDQRDRAQLLECALAAPTPRRFAEAVEAGAGASVVAEIKRRSPSRGDLAVGLDAAETAVAYARGGAACLSVLTDSQHFGGSPGDLEQARGAAGLPVLRKDFTVSPADVCDARVMGADAVLLIVAALSDAELVSFLALAERLALTPLVEVHDQADVARALGAGARVIGVNQRDLHTFEVDRRRAFELAALLPKDLVTVAESGIRGPGDVGRLAEAGYNAVLVGDSPS